MDELTPNIRDFICSYLELDDYGVGRPDIAYPVYSVYYDSDGLQTYHDTINGTKNRFKLRLRYYDDRPGTPVFFEVKGRVDNCILKQRCAVKREAVSLLGSGQLPEPDHLLSREPKHLIALQRFNFLLHKMNARPKAHNGYSREAWVSPNDNSVRVTFDRHVRIEPFFRTEAPVEFTRPTRLFVGFTILEIKFTNRFPNWLREMVQVFNLMWSASAKYAGGVHLIGQHHFHDGYHSYDWQGMHPEETSNEPSPLLVERRDENSLETLAPYV